MDGDGRIEEVVSEIDNDSCPVLLLLDCSQQCTAGINIVEVVSKEVCFRFEVRFCGEGEGRPSAMQGLGGHGEKKIT
jgi:hypothetical protein